MEAMKGPVLVIQTGNADMFSKTLQSAKSVITIDYKPSLQNRIFVMLTVG